MLRAVVPTLQGTYTGDHIDIDDDVFYPEEKEAARSSGDHMVIDDDLLYPEEKERAQL